MLNKIFHKSITQIADKASILKFRILNNKEKLGSIYTIYSDEFNLIEVGFVESLEILNNKLLEKGFILLDKKEGTERELHLLKKTLAELGSKSTSQNYYKFTEITIRHLHTVGWPIGNSIYKPRRIKKEFACA